MDINLSSRGLVINEKVIKEAALPSLAEFSSELGNFPSRSWFRENSNWWVHEWPDLGISVNTPTSQESSTVEFIYIRTESLNEDTPKWNNFSGKFQVLGMDLMFARTEWQNTRDFIYNLWNKSVETASWDKFGNISSSFLYDDINIDWIEGSSLHNLASLFDNASKEIIKNYDFSFAGEIGVLWYTIKVCNGIFELSLYKKNRSELIFWMSKTKHLISIDPHWNRLLSNEESEDQSIISKNKKKMSLKSIKVGPLTFEVNRD